MKNKKLIQFKQIKHVCIKYIDYLQVLNNGYIIIYFGFSVAIVGIAVVFLTSTKNLMNNAKIKAQNILKQQEIVQMIKNNDSLYQKKLKTLGSYNPSDWKIFSPVTFSKLLVDIENENRIVDMKYSLQKIGTVEKNTELFSLSLIMQLKSMRDQNIINFLSQLTKRLPGVVFFEQITIKRESEILSQSEFNELIKCRDKIKQRLMPSFTSHIQCKIVIHASMVDDFVL